MPVWRYLSDSLRLACEQRGTCARFGTLTFAFPVLLLMTQLSLTHTHTFLFPHTTPHMPKGATTFECFNWFSQGLSAVKEDGPGRKEKNTRIIHCYDWNSALPLNYQNTLGRKTPMVVFAKQGEACLFQISRGRKKGEKKGDMTLKPLYLLWLTCAVQT